MPRNKKKQKRSSVSVKQDVFKPEKSIEVLLKEAESAIDTFNYDEAAEKLNNVLQRSADNTKALEMLSGIFLEQSRFDEAESLLKQCINISPHEGYSKYFSLAQLCDGEECIVFYQKGIQILEKELENTENIKPSEEVDKKHLIRILSDAYCSIAESYMTDCCFVENAEAKCLDAVKSAIKTDPVNPEAHQCFASFHIEKDQISEAKECMERSLALWLPHHEALRDGEAQAASVDAQINMPSYDSRIQTAKLLTELEMYEEATNILDGLIEEDDEVAEVWYLQGVLNYTQGDEYKLNAHFYLKKTLEVCKKLGVEDVEFLPQVQDLLVELQATFPLDDEAEDKCQSDIASDSESENEMET